LLNRKIFFSAPFRSIGHFKYDLFKLMTFMLGI
jgi:hypothetical protein